MYAAAGKSWTTSNSHKFEIYRNEINQNENRGGSDDGKYGTGDAKTRVTDTYAAYATVVRTSDLDPSCNSVGETVEVMPSVEDINMYLGKHSHSNDD